MLQYMSKKNYVNNMAKVLLARHMLIIEHSVIH